MQKIQTEARAVAVKVHTGPPLTMLERARVACVRHGGGEQAGGGHAPRWGMDQGPPHINDALLRWCPR